MLFPAQEQALEQLRIQLEKANKASAEATQQRTQIDGLNQTIASLKQDVASLESTVEHFKAIEAKFIQLKELIK